MAKVLLDVGAHVGETLEVALDSRWGFDTIHCFEPAPQCWPALTDLADHRTVIHRFGLWDRDSRIPLFDAGAIGASIFHEKAAGTEPTFVDVKDVGRWLAENLVDGDQVVMKLNCEGAECDVIERMHASGQLHRIDELLVHFDVRKIPGQAHRESEARELLNAAGVTYVPAENIMFGRNTQEKTRNWLAHHHARGIRRHYYSVGKRVEFAIRTRVYEWRKRRVR